MIDGIGGAFIFSNDAQRLADWYGEYLGLEFEGSAEHGAFYQMFWGLDVVDPTQKIPTTFSIMQAKMALEEKSVDAEPEDMYGDQPFMVNLRVRDIDAVLESLSSKGVEAIKREDYDYGRFAWVRDLDGNRVELYQPLAGG
jgi:catechol 2,3-dioxygenase-like lactoylglutathione lyase family enzyme